MIPNHHYNPEADADAIYHAIHGLGTDDKKLVEIVCSRPNHYLAGQVAQVYESKHKKNLIKHVSGDVSGDYGKLMVALVTPRPDFLASEIKNAIKGIGTDEKALMDCLTHTPNALLKVAKDAYTRLFNTSMDKDIRSDVGGDFRKVLVDLLDCNRNENPNVDLNTAKEQAKTLYKKGEGKIGTDDEYFINFFTNQSPQFIAAVDKAYRDAYQRNLVQAIDSETSGVYGNALKALAKPKDLYFAERIHDAIAGIGTNDALLRRCFVLLDKPELQQVAITYGKVYGRALEDDVKKDTGGWYQKALLALIQLSWQSNISI